MKALKDIFGVVRQHNCKESTGKFKPMTFGALQTEINRLKLHGSIEFNFTKVTTINI